MKVFLAGVGGVGQRATGACLAVRLGWRFCDLDMEIEEHFGKPLDRLRADVLTPYSFRKQFADAIEEVIRGFFGRLDNATVVSLWPETETSMAHDAKDLELLPEPVRRFFAMQLSGGLMELQHRPLYHGASLLR